MEAISWEPRLDQFDRGVRDLLRLFALDEVEVGLLLVLEEGEVPLVDAVGALDG